VAQILDVFGLLSVLLRGCTLAFQSLVIGGIVFELVVLSRAFPDPRARPGRRLIFWAAAGLAAAQACYVGADTLILMESTGLRFSEFVGANYFVAGGSSIMLALAVLWLNSSQPRQASAVKIAVCLGILAATVSTSHAAARVDDRALLIVLTVLHHAATGTWIGGLPYLMAALRQSGETEAGALVCSRFSRLALISAGTLFAAGVGLTFLYVGSAELVYGTAYGAMVAAKIYLFGSILTIGGFNFFLVRRIRAGDYSFLSSLRRFTEAEIGVGFAVILVAASLTSQPPATDLASERLTAAELIQRIAPRAPRLEPPAADQLYPPDVAARIRSGPSGLASFVPGQLSAPITPEEIVLSEFNHNWSGLIVFLAGFFALLARLGVRAARAWPLAFLALAVFVFFMADADYWPLGPLNFWHGFLVSEVLIHRLVVPLIAAFAIFEWRVQTGRARSGFAALVFPAVCAVGGTLLITHSHSLNNVKEELLAELSHIPIALFGITAGWTRWLELRLPGGPRKAMAWIWPASFMLVGLVLLFYRES